MLSYKDWKTINESFGFVPLGLRSPNTVGVMGSFIKEAGFGKPLEDEENVDDMDDDEDKDDADLDGEGPPKKFPPEETPDEDLGDDGVPPELAGGDDDGVPPELAGDLGDDGVPPEVAAGTPPGIPGSAGMGDGGLAPVDALSDEDLAAIDDFSKGEEDVPPELAGDEAELADDEDKVVDDEDKLTDDEDEDEDEIARSMRSFMSKDKKCCSCSKHCSDKCRKACPKCGKKCSDESFGYESEDAFREDLLKQMTGTARQKWDDGMDGAVKTEDAIYAMIDANADLTTQPGDQGFAPQGKLGTMGGGGYTKDDINASIPTMEI